MFIQCVFNAFNSKDLYDHEDEGIGKFVDRAVGV
jgi:hypothetical protein